MVVYVGQCGEVYQGPTFPEHHGKACDLRHNHAGRHSAPTVGWNEKPDRIEFYDARQKARRVELNVRFP
jgi:hypothetical protein